MPILYQTYVWSQMLRYNHIPSFIYVLKHDIFQNVLDFYFLKMGRLSKKKAPAVDVKSQSKITGFFQEKKLNLE